jgi:hypothetical protein
MLCCKVEFDGRLSVYQELFISSPRLAHILLEKSSICVRSKQLDEPCSVLDSFGLDERPLLSDSTYLVL